MRKMINKEPENCEYCHLSIDLDIYGTFCKCGAKKCYYDCKTESEKDEWNELFF